MNTDELIDGKNLIYHHGLCMFLISATLTTQNTYNFVVKYFRILFFYSEQVYFIFSTIPILYISKLTQNCILSDLHKKQLNIFKIELQ